MSDKMNTIIAEGQAALLNTYNRFPVAWQKGKGVYLWDIEGKKYLDLVAGIAVNILGYDHPRLTHALAKKARCPLHVSNLFYIPEQIHLAETLIDKTFPGRVFFCNSGAEANEAAVKFARKWGGGDEAGGRYEILTTERSFHGRTLGMIAASGQERLRRGFGPVVGGFKTVPYDNVEAAREAVGALTVAIMVEPIQGEAGVRIPSRNYLKGLKDLCQEKHLLLILDEVQTGVGRTGTFCAYQQAGILPDVITLAKGLGGGVPIGAMIVRENLAEAMGPGDHASTFGGNPLVTHIAQTVLETLDKDELLAHCREMGDYFLKGLKALEQRYSSLLEGARGCGLMLAVDVKFPARPFVEAGLQKGLVLNAVQEKTLRFVPPLIIKRKEIDEALSLLDNMLKDVA